MTYTIHYVHKYKFFILNFEKNSWRVRLSNDNIYRKKLSQNDNLDSIFQDHKNQKDEDTILQ